MSLPLIRPALVVAAALVVSGCANYGSKGYGYTSLSYGYGTTYRPYYGWYGSYYYPGVGIYVYDRYGTSHRWNNSQRRYWEARQDRRYERRENWSGYHRHRGGRGDRRRR